MSKFKQQTNLKVSVHCRTILENWMSYHHHYHPSVIFQDNPNFWNVVLLFHKYIHIHDVWCAEFQFRKIYLQGLGSKLKCLEGVIWQS